MPPKDKKSVPGADTNASRDSQRLTKRKEPPNTSRGSHRGNAKRVRTHDSRAILAQPTDAALNEKGELDLQAFIKANEFAIKSLDDGMQRSKTALSTRAFQEVPRALRRRTASHNVKRVPKRLQNRAAKEMKDDNTPTVLSKNRKPRDSRGRIRAETVQRLKVLAAKNKSKNEGITTRPPNPKIRKNVLSSPTRPKSKFRKRQIHKTWLPTHLWHAKRAKMTDPQKSLWRFAIPLTPTEKSYRPTHRAGRLRGAIAWDVSYFSTITMHGAIEGLERVLKIIGLSDSELWGKAGEKWRAGKRSWTGWLHTQAGTDFAYIGPSTVAWYGTSLDCVDKKRTDAECKRPLGNVFLRVHPSAFLQTWNELLRLSKLQRPAVHLEDLRFEIGSIEITGPASTEALLGVINPYPQPGDSIESHAEVFKSLTGLTNPASLPRDVLLSFSIIDPRLRHPHRPKKQVESQDSSDFLETLSNWPADSSYSTPSLFNRNSRFKATHLPSQKSLNRRKALALPGSYAPILPADPPIPIMLLTSRKSSKTNMQGTWTLLAPWKCIQPLWYGLMHYPLSSGGNPRFGGLQELQQIHFEYGVPWYPSDFPGTLSGSQWEIFNREKRKADWERRPKGKRVEWSSLDLGAGRKGEIGSGWACDFERLFSRSKLHDDGEPMTSTAERKTQNNEMSRDSSPISLRYMPTRDFVLALSRLDPIIPEVGFVATVRITLASRGSPSPCARIYRLPIPPKSSCQGEPNLPKDLREQWLSLLPTTKQKQKHQAKPKFSTTKDVTDLAPGDPVSQRIRLLAQSLLERPPRPYPPLSNEEMLHPLVPNEEDLIGFVTAGEFNLAEGKGTCIGTLAVARVVEALKQDHKGGKLCIVRNSGEKIGRLAYWEAV